MATPSSTYDSASVEEGRLATVNGWLIGAVIALLVILYPIGLAIGGELGQIMVASLQTIPFVLLALLAYLGIDRLWAKVAAYGWLALLAGGGAFLAFGMALAALLNGPMTPGALPALVPGAGPKLALLSAGMLVALIVAGLGLIPAVRRGLSRWLPLDPNSFVHTIALVAVVALTLVSFPPLIVLGEPPLLTTIARNLDGGVDITGGRGDSGLLRDTLYAFIWLLPGTLFAVGYGVRRDLRATLARLGLVRPTGRQVLFGLGMAVVLVLGVGLLSTGIEWLWGLMGWPKTDNETFSALLGFAMSLIGAVVIGVTAGLGEELAIRGVLQPRLGILPSNLFFTSLHAFQYSWDALLVVFIIGMVLGLIRRRTNTTTSAIVHGTYNFLLIMAAVLQLPWLGQ